MYPKEEGTKSLQNSGARSRKMAWNKTFSIMHNRLIISSNRSAQNTCTMLRELKGDYRISYFIMNKKEDSQPRKLTSAQPQTEEKVKVKVTFTL